jgi:hypothetical protein
VGINGYSSVGKCEELKHNARVVGEAMEAMKQALGDVSGTREVRVFLVPEVALRPRYSVIHISDPELRLGAPLGLGLYLRRPDIEVQSYRPGETVPPEGNAAGTLKRLRLDTQSGRAELTGGS